MFSNDDGMLQTTPALLGLLFHVSAVNADARDSASLEKVAIPVGPNDE